MKLYDVTLRDGLMYRPPVSRTVKREYLTAMEALGLRQFEVVRFPLDGQYPQFDDGVALLETLARARRAGTRLAVFAFNAKGVAEALGFAALYDELHVPCFVSDAYADYAFGPRLWAETLGAFARDRENCEKAGVELTVGLGTAFGCPLRPGHRIEWTVARARDLVELGVRTLMIGDTAGMAHPALVAETMEALRRELPPCTLRVHMHDTFGRALLNSHAAALAGADGIDASLMGLGGEPHPYFREPARVNNGNCALEEVYPLLMEAGLAPAFDTRALYAVCRRIADLLAGPIYGRAGFAELVPLPEDDHGQVQQGTGRH